MRRKDFLSIDQLNNEELGRLIGRALEFKQNPLSAPDLLSNRTLALLFQKPSLRTRVSFEVGMLQLGGRAIYLSPAEVGLGDRESPADVARVLSRYVNGIVARTFLHRDVEALAAAAASHRSSHARLAPCNMASRYSSAVPLPSLLFRTARPLRRAARPARPSGREGDSRPDRTRPRPGPR